MKDANLIGDYMVRDVVTAALEARTKAGIKVRQPLSLLRVLIDETIFNDEFKLIIADEVNVKEVVLDKTIERMVELDTILTPELIAEGNAREFMRGVQERRKAEGLAPQDRVALTVATSAEGKLILEQFAEMIKKTVGATELNFADTEGTEIKAGDVNFVVALKKL